MYVPENMYLHSCDSALRISAWECWLRVCQQRRVCQSSCCNLSAEAWQVSYAPTKGRGVKTAIDKWAACVPLCLDFLHSKLQNQTDLHLGWKQVSVGRQQGLGDVWVLVSTQDVNVGLVDKTRSQLKRFRPSSEHSPVDCTFYIWSFRTNEMLQKCEAGFSTWISSVGLSGMLVVEHTHISNSCQSCHRDWHIFLVHS